VYVLRPAGFFQKAISEVSFTRQISVSYKFKFFFFLFQVSNKFFKDEFRFRVIICATSDELYEHVTKSQLTSDLGGDLIYSHHEWIQQRIVSFAE
jgi:pleckstrin homology domain-containing family G member 4